MLTLGCVLWCWAVRAGGNAAAWLCKGRKPLDEEDCCWPFLGAAAWSSCCTTWPTLTAPSPGPPLALGGHRRRLVGPACRRAAEGSALVVHVRNLARVAVSGGGGRLLRSGTGAACRRRKDYMAGPGATIWLHFHRQFLMDVPFATTNWGSIGQNAYWSRG